MKRRKFKALSLCSMILICLPIIVLIIFYFSPDLNEKFIIEKEFIGILGVILQALEGVAKLYAKVSKNKGATYKKIVPKERVDWIRDLRAYLAKLLGIMEESDGRLKDLDEVAFKKDIGRAKELYFIIVSSLNVNGEDEDLKEIRAILSLNKYLKNKGLDLPLNFNVSKLPYIYYDEKKGVLKNCTLKNKCLVYKINGTSEEVMKVFTMIFKEAWEEAKKEAD